MKWILRSVICVSAVLAALIVLAVIFVEETKPFVDLYANHARWPFYKSLSSCQSVGGGGRSGGSRGIGRNAVDESQTTLGRIVAGGVFG